MEGLVEQICKDLCICSLNETLHLKTEKIFTFELNVTLFEKAVIDILHVSPNTNSSSLS